jgi:hypothetical protein
VPCWRSRWSPRRRPGRRPPAADIGPVTLTAGEVDITDFGGTVTAQFGSPTPGEDVGNVIDNTPYRKYFTQHNVAWIQFAPTVPATVTGYTLTSANDAPDRNPRGWTLQGSADGAAWTTLDSRSIQTFLVAYGKNRYAFVNTTPYRFYRLSVTAINGSPDLQIGEWQILGTTTATPPPPAAPRPPSGVPALQVRSKDHVEINWTDATRFETGYQIQRRVGAGAWVTVVTVPPGNTRYVDRGLTAGSTYQYQVRAKGIASSGWLQMGSATTLAAAQHPSMVETLHGDPGYNETVPLFGTAGNVAAYRTSALSGTDLSWARDWVRAIWDDTRATYGRMGNEQLYAVFQPGGGGGTARTLYDADSYYRNMIDAEAGVPPVSSYERRKILAHEIGHVVESSASGVQGSPAATLWGDSKWCEIYQYDAYVGIGSADAALWRQELLTKQDTFPRPGTRWFADWFIKIYDGYPGADFRGIEVLRRFFGLLAAHFHAFNGAYQRDLNWGEVVHFWSGAANKDLQPLAASAFGWPAEWADQLSQAKTDFPGVTYRA